MGCICSKGKEKVNLPKQQKQKQNNDDKSKPSDTLPNPQNHKSSPSKHSNPSPKIESKHSNEANISQSLHLEIENNSDSDNPKDQNQIKIASSHRSHNFDSNYQSNINQYKIDNSDSEADLDSKINEPISSHIESPKQSHRMAVRPPKKISNASSSHSSIQNSNIISPLYLASPNMSQSQRTDSDSDDEIEIIKQAEMKKKPKCDVCGGTGKLIKKGKTVSCKYCPEICKACDARGILSKGGKEIECFKCNRVGWIIEKHDTSGKKHKTESPKVGVKNKPECIFCHDTGKVLKKNGTEKHCNKCPMLCDKCNGTGKIEIQEENIHIECKNCRGSGYVYQ